MVLFLLIISHFCISSQAGQVQLDIVLDDILSEQIPIKFWRASLDKVEILESRIFPMASLDSDGSLNNLGRAWITWTIQINELKIPAYAIYDRGSISHFFISDNFYQEVYWFGVKTDLFMVTSASDKTYISFIGETGPVGTRSLPFNSTNHHAIVTSGIQQLFLMANGTSPNIVTINPITYQLEVQQTSFNVLSTIPNYALVQLSENETGIIGFGISNPIILPSEVSNTSKIGHILLEPAVFDIYNKLIYYDNQLYSLPNNTIDVFPFGLASSLILTSNNSIYEFTTEGWVYVDSYENDLIIQDFAIVDFELYLGTTPIQGLQFLVSGLDEDKDSAPDTLESYLTSSPLNPDTDSDGMGDYLEIAYGLNVIVNDRNVDYDNDGLVNFEELVLDLDPKNEDSDFGGAIDGWEYKFGYDYHDPQDDLLDPDGDGVPNSLESRWESSPFETDTDGDNIPDGWEIRYKLNPNNSNDALSDPDNDQRNNLQEFLQDSDPLYADPLSIFYGLDWWVVIILLTGIYLSYLTQKRSFTN